jgi:hypothetical protein
LAAATESTPGAVATRLSRARATLRLEFVLAYRRATLPTPSCRPVLVALSAGDRRRQRRLDAAGHLRTCDACAGLAAPVSERRRGIAVWLLLPIAEAVRRIARVLRRNHWAQAATVAAAAVSTVIAINATDEPDRAAPAAPITTAATSTTARPAPSTSPPSTAAPTTTAPVTTSPGACPAPRPLDDVTTAPRIGCPIADTTLTVLDVPRDEGFWAQTATGGVLWIQLTGEGESPVDVQAGSRLTVRGTISEPAAAADVATDPRVVVPGFVLTVPFDGMRAG